MAIFIVFWCAILGLLFWLLSVIVKSIQAAIYGVFDSIIKCGIIIVFGLFCCFVLYLFYQISSEIRTGTLFDTLFMIVICVILFSVFFGWLCGIGLIVLELVAAAVYGLIEITIICLEAMNTWTETAYVFFLRKIKRKVELL